MSTFVAILYCPPGTSGPLCIVKTDNPELLGTVARFSLSEIEAQLGSPGDRREAKRRLCQLRSLLAVLLPEPDGVPGESTIVM